MAEQEESNAIAGSDHRHHERMYAKLLDAVEGETDGEDEKEELIKDQQTLDLLIVFGKSFALNGAFWRVGVIALVQGVLMGFVALGFFNGFDYVSRTWLGAWGGEFYDKGMHNATLKFGCGRWWWVAVTTLAGLAVGLLKLVPVINFPDKPKGLFSEVKELHVEPKQAPGIAILSCLSLAAGATVGPEMALGSLGGAVGTLIGEWRNLPKEERFASTLTGMAGAMGPLLPTPVLSVLLLHELSVIAGRPVEHFMEFVCETGIASTVSWFIFQRFADETYLDLSTVPISVYDVTTYWKEYKHIWLLYSILMGFIGGLLGMLTLICMGIFRNIAANVRRKLGKKTSTVVLPVVAGLVYGIFGVLYPLTFGDGSMQLGHIVGHAKEWGESYLVGTMFIKMLTLSISLGFGFIGGQIFPAVFIGTCAGCVAYLVTNVPIFVTVPCFMVAVPGAFCPIPFTLVGIAVLGLVLGSEITACVFTSVFCAFMTACGTGIIQRLVRRGGEKQAILDAEFDEAEKTKQAVMRRRLAELENENRLLRKISTNMHGFSPDDLAGILHGDLEDSPGVTSGMNHPSPYL